MIPGGGAVRAEGDKSLNLREFSSKSSPAQAIAIRRDQAFLRLGYTTSIVWAVTDLLTKACKCDISRGVVESKREAARQETASCRFLMANQTRVAARTRATAVTMASLVKSPVDHSPAEMASNGEQ